MGINCDKFQLRTPQQIGEKLKLVSVARLTEKKGLEFAIKAAALLIKNNTTKINYKIIGGGELMKPLRLMIEKYNHKTILIFLAGKIKIASLTFCKNLTFSLLQVLQQLTAIWKVYQWY